MTKEINARRKYLIAIICLVVALLATSGAIVGIYAATNQGLGSRFVISYQLNDVVVDVSAKYQVVGMAEVNFEPIKFDVNTPSSENLKYLGTKNWIVLNKQSPEVVVTYTFTNPSQTEVTKISPTWTKFATDINNMNVKYESSAGQYSSISSAADIAALETTLNPGAEKSFVFKFRVADDSKIAHVSSSEDGGIYFALTHVA